MGTQVVQQKIHWLFFVFLEVTRLDTVNATATLESEIGRDLWMDEQRDLFLLSITVTLYNCGPL